MNPEQPAPQETESLNSPPKSPDDPAAEVASEVTSQLSDDDLGLGSSSSDSVSDVDPSAPLSNDTPPVLEEAYEVVERYEDDTIKRRWFVRLYVTFDRAKPWHQQSPGSWMQHGKFEEYYPGGTQLLSAGQFHEGKRHGEWTYYHPGGQVAKQGEYRHAQLEGPWNYFRPDGTLLRSGTYQAHQMHGTWRYYDTDGKTVVREETYEHNQRVASN